MTPADFPAISAALLLLRPRAKATRKPERANAAGLAFTWLAMDDGAELLGVSFRAQRLAAPQEEPDVAALVALLPDELVPEKVTVDRERHALVIRFRTQRGHFRCRDCGWGDATDAKGTHPGTCAPCASERNVGVRRAHLREGP